MPQNDPFDLGHAMIGLQYSIHQPSTFIHRHQADLLPDWQVDVSSLMVVLQPCTVQLNHTSSQTELQKRRLRRRFLSLAKTLILQLHREGYAAEGFDPRTGAPFYSRCGRLTLDDAAVVQAVLGYPLVPSGNCRVIEHPVWGCSVFPSVIVSSAAPSTLAEIAHRLWQIHSSPALFKDLDPAFAGGRGWHILHSTASGHHGNLTLLVHPDAEPKYDPHFESWTSGEQ